MLGKFRMKTQVATYDTGESLRLKYPMILKLLQEAAMRQLEEEGIGYEEMRAKGVVFLMTRVNLNIYTLPRAGELVTVETWFHGLKGVQFIRDMRMIGEKGEICAEAQSLWITADPQAHRIVRPSAFPFQAVLKPYEGDCVAVTEQKIKTNELAELQPEFRQIRFSDIDCNAHVNNAVYADMLCDYFPGGLSGREIESLQIVFHNEAVLGEKLSIKAGIGGTQMIALFEGRIGEKRCFEAVAGFRSKHAD